MRNEDARMLEASEGEGRHTTAGSRLSKNRGFLKGRWRPEALPPLAKGTITNGVYFVVTLSKTSNVVFGLRSLQWDHNAKGLRHEFWVN